MNTVTVLTFNEPEQAGSMKQRLEAAGFPAHVVDERKLQRTWFLSESLAGIHVQVHKENFERVKNLLAEWHAADGCLRDAIHCPECGSSRVEYPQFTRKFISPSLYAVLCKIGLFKKKFYCEECHYTWPIRYEVESEKDLLGWPIKRHRHG